MIELPGGSKLANLKAHDVQGALDKLATQWSSRTVRLYRMVMVRAIRLVQVNDLAMRNVAELTTVPKGQPGRPSKAMTLQQALTLLHTAKTRRLWPYFATPLSRSCRIPASRSNRSRMRSATPAPGRQTRCTGIRSGPSSGRLLPLTRSSPKPLATLPFRLPWPLQRTE